MSGDQGWTDRDDAAQCCPSLLGAVEDSEYLARLIHSTIEEPKGNPFKREEMFPPKGEFSNVCGESHGTSLVRRDGISDEELCDRASRQAERKPGRVGRGAFVAKSAELREIEHPDRPGEVAIRIYDDPMATDQHHCVLRASPVPRTLQSEIRNKVRALFNRHIISPDLAEA